MSFRWINENGSGKSPVRFYCSVQWWCSGYSCQEDAHLLYVYAQHRRLSAGIYMWPSKPRLEICEKKIWGRSHIYKNSSRKQTQKKEGLCIWKCICILKAPAKAAPLVPVLTDTAGDRETAARQWQRGAATLSLPGAVHIPCSWTSARQ